MAYWLMKSEPDTYSIDDLEREVKNAWEGCRNYTVRNFFRDRFEPGDLAFFYHSNAVPSGITGVMRVESKGYADHTQYDPKSDYYDPKAKTDPPTWLLVDVSFVRKFDRVIPLSELRENPDTAGMAVCMRGQRLSVMPVTEEEWKAVMAMVEPSK